MTSAIWRCRTTQALNLLSKRQMKTKTCFGQFFFFFLDSAFVRCKESCRFPRRLLVDNTLLDLHYFPDSTQPYLSIAKMLNLASIILITVLKSLQKSVIWINSDFLVTQENERGHWVPLEQYIGATGLVAAQNYTINPAVQEPAVIYRWFLTTYASLWLHNRSDSLSFRCLSHVNTTLGHSTQNWRRNCYFPGVWTKFLQAIPKLILGALSPFQFRTLSRDFIRFKPSQPSKRI